MSAWTKQLPSQVAKRGADKASWYCEWDEPDGTRRIKSCGPGKGGKRNAERLAERIRAELLTGTYNRDAQVRWSDFLAEYDRKVLSRPDMAPASRRDALTALKHFERILKLKDKNLSHVTTARVDDFRAKRSGDPGKKKGSQVSVATINSNMRFIKAALRMAAEWKYIDSPPKFKFLREPKRMLQPMTGEHFAAIYTVADKAEKPTKPGGLPFELADWWRGLLMFAYMTGWRIGEILSLRWEDVDMKAGTALTRHADNKGKRDELVPLHPIVVDHIAKLKSFEPAVFPWGHDRRTLDVEFHRLQGLAGIHLACPHAGDKRHGQCTDACHRYGFHDERRAFATNNEGQVSAETLQRLMRHQSYATTQRYIEMARKLKPAVENLHVPTVPSVAGKIG